MKQALVEPRRPPGADLGFCVLRVTGINID
jgi:hypothetical protein